jgi:membrane dipeptidase
MKVVIDGHSDMLLDIQPRLQSGEKHVLKNYWLPKMKRGNIDIRVVALYCDSQYLPELALRKSLDLIAMLYDELETTDDVMLCKSIEDIASARRDKRIGLILGMEGAEPLGSDIDLLTIFYTLGLRLLGLTHSRRTFLADGAFFSQKRAGRPGGLSSIGIEFLERAQEMGMLIDVSHLNDPGFWDVVKYSKSPFVASHSNCRALCDHPRNLSDEQIKAIADSGGVIGVNACKAFLNYGTKLDLLEHIDHLIKIGGVGVVGLGPDFADYLPQHMSDTERNRYPIDGIMPIQGFRSEEDIPVLVQDFENKGYSEAVIEGIMGGNFLRVFESVFT